MDNGAWGALALALTVLAGIWTWFAFRRRGIASGVRGAGITLLPVAAYLTHTLKMLGRVGDAVGDWATALVFSPAVWVGVVLAAVGVLLIFVSAKLPGRTPSEGSSRERSTGEVPPRQLPKQKSARGGDGGVADTLGDDLDDINAILKKHGIS